MFIKTLLVLLIFCMPLFCMDLHPIVFWKQSGDQYESQIIPKDCLRLVFKPPAFDLQGMCLLGKTCKNFHAYFEDMIVRRNVCDKADTDCMDTLIKNNYAQCTKMLISYANGFEEAEPEYKKEEENILNYSYGDYPEVNRKKLFLLLKQKLRCEQIFNCLYQHSLESREELNSKVRGTETELYPIQIYSGKIFTSDLKSKAFFAFLREKEFDLMLQVVRKNVDFFRTYYCKDGYRTYHILHYVYEQEGIELVKKIVACGIDIKTPLELCRDGSAYYTLLYAGHIKNDQETIDLLLSEKDEYKKGMKNPLGFSEIRNVGTGQLKEINMERVKLLLSRYYTQKGKNELLKDALKCVHQFDTRNWVGILLKYGADLKSLPLYLLCRYGDIDVVKSVFTQKNIEASQCSPKDQFFIIYYSMDSGNLALLDFICSQGFHPDTTDDKTALYCAVKDKRWESAKILLKHGADINNHRIIDDICLCLGSERYKEQIQFLVDNGINIDNIIATINDLITNSKKNYWQDHLEYFMKYKTQKETNLEVIDNSNIGVSDKTPDQKDGRKEKPIKSEKSCVIIRDDDNSGEQLTPGNKDVFDTIKAPSIESDDSSTEEQVMQNKEDVSFDIPMKPFIRNDELPKKSNYFYYAQYRCFALATAILRYVLLEILISACFSSTTA